MSEEEFLKRNNYLMSHGHLPYDTTTCETWGLSGNCGKNCPNFKIRLVMYMLMFWKELIKNYSNKTKNIKK